MIQIFAPTAERRWTGRMMVMKKLIELGVAIDTAICAVDEYDGGYNIEREKRIRDALMALPTVNPVPVKRGRWIKKRYWSEGVGMGERYGYYYSCSKCGNWVRGGYDECGKKYCDECGALMDGKDGDGNG